LALLIENPSIGRPCVKQASYFLWRIPDVDVSHIGHVLLILNFQTVRFILPSRRAAFSTHFTFLSFVSLQQQIVQFVIIHLSVLAPPRQRNSAMLFASGQHNGLIFGIEVPSELHIAYFV
jgi:hypothetical protein